MVLGLRSKNRKDNSVQVEYLVHVHDIKPWPLSESYRSVQSVLVQWENGDRNSGDFTSAVGDTNIQFNESFTLPLTVCRERRNRDKFQKNYLEFCLYESRKDKAAKGQLLGTAIINLADYGIIDEILTFRVPLNFKKSSKNAVQPILSVEIQPVDKNSSASSPMVSLSKAVSLDKDEQESVSELMNEGDESEIASFTDDDVSSHSSRTIASSTFEAAGTSPSQHDKNGLKQIKESTGWGSGEPALYLGVEFALPLVNPRAEVSQHSNVEDTLSDQGHTIDDHLNVSDLMEMNMTSIRKKLATPYVLSSSSLGSSRDTDGESAGRIRSVEHENSGKDLLGKMASTKSRSKKNAELLDLEYSRDTQVNIEDDELPFQQRKTGKLEATNGNNVHVDQVVGKGKKEQGEVEQVKDILEEKGRSSENKPIIDFLQDAAKRKDTLRSDSLMSSRRALGGQGTAIADGKLRHVKSIQLPFDSTKANGSFAKSENMARTKRIHELQDAHDDIPSNSVAERKDQRNGFKETKSEWESKIQLLEEELREAAALEVGLYSAVAEHGGSMNKLHAPARRLSRFYFHACKARFQAKRASAARAVISGLVLVSKACGNDVPRLSFWFSNSIMLRAVISKAAGEMPLSGGSSPTVEDKSNSTEELDDWEDPQTFTVALENIEAWIFSRIVESVWWQTLTPHMQSTAANSHSRSMGLNSRKTNGKSYSLGDQGQGNFSIELWKKAFKDACERLCPIRAGGHECGCLPVLARLVMEQLVSRLDVAMFNAILRESTEEMPTDPVSDPISDSKILPIPAGKSSFGAGAQLKNAIGTWSRWLTDLFGIEDNDSPEDTDNLSDEKTPECDTSFKPFRLLNALSDLMMLPFEMLAYTATRKEVCPTFGAPLILRVLNNFVPDEFCPDPIPEAILEALDSEDALEAAEESLSTFPCIATPTIYSPLESSLAGFIGGVRGQALERSASSVLKKAYASDDELDELESPLTSVIADHFRGSPMVKKPSWMPKGNSGRKVVRYQLLREVWRDGE